MQSIEWESLKDRLVLEIQRSLDYYESQMGQIPINRIVIAQRQYDGAALAAELNDMLSAQVSVLSLTDHLNSTTQLTPESQQIPACLALLGEYFLHLRYIGKQGSLCL
jgi:MSHA biogenesis protein MshI